MRKKTFSSLWTRVERLELVAGMTGGASDYETWLRTLSDDEFHDLCLVKATEVVETCGHLEDADAEAQAAVEQAHRILANLPKEMPRHDATHA